MFIPCLSLCLLKHLFVMLNSSPMVLSLRFQFIWVEFLLPYVLWLPWSLSDFLFQLSPGKWCHGLVCFWCTNGHLQSSFCYLEVISIWFINGERWLKQDPFLLDRCLLIMNLKKVFWFEIVVLFCMIMNISSYQISL